MSPFDQPVNFNGPVPIGVVLLFSADRVPTMLDALDRLEVSLLRVHRVLATGTVDGELRYRGIEDFAVVEGDAGTKLEGICQAIS